MKISTKSRRAFLTAAATAVLALCGSARVLAAPDFTDLATPEARTLVAGRVEISWQARVADTPGNFEVYERRSSGSRLLATSQALRGSLGYSVEVAVSGHVQAIELRYVHPHGVIQVLQTVRIESTALDPLPGSSDFDTSRDMPALLELSGRTNDGLPTGAEPGPGKHVACRHRRGPEPPPPRSGLHT